VKFLVLGSDSDAEDSGALLEKIYSHGRHYSSPGLKLADKSNASQSTFKLSTVWYDTTKWNCVMSVA